MTRHLKDVSRKIKSKMLFLIWTHFFTPCSCIGFIFVSCRWSYVWCLPGVCSWPMLFSQKRSNGSSSTSSTVCCYTSAYSGRHDWCASFTENFTFGQLLQHSVVCMTLLTVIMMTLFLYINVCKSIYIYRAHSSNGSHGSIVVSMLTWQPSDHEFDSTLRRNWKTSGTNLNLVPRASSLKYQEKVKTDCVILTTSPT